MSLKKTLGLIGSINVFIIADILVFMMRTAEAYKYFLVSQVLFVAALLGLKQNTGLVEAYKARMGVEASKEQ